MCSVGQPEDIVEESVLLVPEAFTVHSKLAHRVRDMNKVFPEFTGYIFVGLIFFREFERNGQQVQRVHRHPAGAVGLLEVAASRKRSAAVEYTDVVEAQE